MVARPWDTKLVPSASRRPGVSPHSGHRCARKWGAPLLFRCPLTWLMTWLGVAHLGTPGHRLYNLATAIQALLPVSQTGHTIVYLPRIDTRLFRGVPVLAQYLRNWGSVACCLRARHDQYPLLQWHKKARV